MPGPVTAATPGKSPGRACDASRSDASVNRPHVDAGGRFVHWCMHPGCKRWGSHGSVFDWRRYQAAEAAGEADAIRHLGEWYCAEHAALHWPKPCVRQVPAGKGWSVPKTKAAQIKLL